MFGKFHAISKLVHHSGFVQICSQISVPNTITYGKVFTAGIKNFWLRDVQGAHDPLM